MVEPVEQLSRAQTRLRPGAVDPEQDTLELGKVQAEQARAAVGGKGLHGHEVTSGMRRASHPWPR